MADSDVEKIFEKGEEGMKNAEGFIRQMVSVWSCSLVLVTFRGLSSPNLTTYRRWARPIHKSVLLITADKLTSMNASSDPLF